MFLRIFSPKKVCRKKLWDKVYRLGETPTSHPFTDGFRKKVVQTFTYHHLRKISVNGYEFCKVVFVMPAEGGVYIVSVHRSASPSSDRQVLVLIFFCRQCCDNVFTRLALPGVGALFWLCWGCSTLAWVVSP